MSDNMKLWREVEKTDPKFTKLTSNGRFSFTCVDPQYQLQIATDLWGPYGERWGLNNTEFTPVTAGTETTLMLTATFYYPSEDGTRITFPIAVDLKFRHGDDCCKKLLTTARSKALSYLGFNADIYLGKFDDAQYVHDRETEFGDRDQFMKRALARIKTSNTAEEIASSKKRVDELVADATIDAAQGRTLYAAIEEQQQTIGG